MTKSVADYLKDAWPVRVGSDIFLNTRDGRIKIESALDILLAANHAREWEEVIRGAYVYGQTRERGLQETAE